MRELALYRNRRLGAGGHPDPEDIGSAARRKNADAREHQIERIGEQLRAMMPWLKKGKAPAATQ